MCGSWKDRYGVDKDSMKMDIMWMSFIGTAVRLFIQYTDVLGDVKGPVGN